VDDPSKTQFGQSSNFPLKSLTTKVFPRSIYVGLLPSSQMYSSLLFVFHGLLRFLSSTAFPNYLHALLVDLQITLATL
jgi:hypothetical protein